MTQYTTKRGIIGGVFVALVSVSASSVLNDLEPTQKALVFNLVITLGLALYILTEPWDENSSLLN